VLGNTIKLEQSLMIYFICVELKGSMNLKPLLISIRHLGEQRVDLQA
jgi:hypothetical protein